MDAGRPFSYVFEDSSWLVKLLIGGLLGISFFLTPSLMGYLVDTARNVRDGRELPLPEWGEDFGGRWVRGLKLIVIYLVWSLVLMLPFLCLAVLIAVVAGTGGGAGGAGDASGAEGVAAVMGLVLNCLSIPLTLVIIFFQPAIMAHYVELGTISSGFQVGDIWRRMSANWSEYLILWLLFLVASFISGLGAIACGIGILITYPYASLIQAHLIGQFVRTQPATGSLDLA